ncbi:hypothetical protein NTE_02110 [Candidatus Nitrososphaera evergladensis SR1]|uniref:Uncharacterized protein n=1 Tax=Candidatus Nitrososphaera evergladensis SR1 TaxID=1459636 RepID=A0A075MSP7_9ARCH|nr:hypothetical protein NTE_02110 [Candidatus Nitrososphaera evergladensis SR1]
MINKKGDIKFSKIDDYTVEGLLSTLTREFGLFSCKKCGAMVILPDTENKGDTRSLQAHSAWHDMQTKVKRE